jgi:putative radical SAM enzyme (TIGR03279 family)
MAVEGMLGAEIVAVEAGSLAEGLGLTVGDSILKINHKAFTDLIEFEWAWATEKVFLEIRKSNGQRDLYEIEKDYDEPLGVGFKEAIFDGIRRCHNQCMFCFVEQMPRQMRPSLYLKDDDYRLSFLQGNYITLTNLKEEDLVRIKREHLSPLYVSVHTTAPQLRKRMMKNSRAGALLEIMKDLSREGIEFHTQVVACPGVNDGEVLEKTYHDLSRLASVVSLAVVPVGLTSYRHNLPKLRLYEKEEAYHLVKWVEEKQKLELAKRGSRFIWASDEFYLLADLPLPTVESYEDFSQLENGVGMVRLFWEKWQSLQLPKIIEPAQEIIFVTGLLGKKVLKPVRDRLNTIQGLKIEVRAIPNSFFGTTVTVAGLLTGSCLLAGLKGIKKGSVVFIPASMLQSGDGKFLDDLTPKEVGEILGIQIITVPVEPEKILAKIMEQKGGAKND